MYAHEKFAARPTLDIDFLGNGISNNEEKIVAAFREICSVPCEEDVVRYDVEHITSKNITELKDYHGVRLSIPVSMDTVAQIMTMDIGFGDVVTPAPVELEYPALLDNLPAANILAYSLETVVAGDCGFGFEKPGYYEQVFNRNAPRLSKSNNCNALLRLFRGYVDQCVNIVQRVHEEMRVYLIPQTLQTILQILPFQPLQTPFFLGVTAVILRAEIHSEHHHRKYNFEYRRVHRTSVIVTRRLRTTVPMEIFPVIGRHPAVIVQIVVEQRSVVPGISVVTGIFRRDMSLTAFNPLRAVTPHRTVEMDSICGKKPQKRERAENIWNRTSPADEHRREDEVMNGKKDDERERRQQQPADKERPERDGDARLRVVQGDEKLHKYHYSPYYRPHHGSTIFPVKIFLRHFHIPHIA